ncbi:MAG: mechanosensitive ion channel family protein [Desulfobacteraceae bacterium]|nr:MAG: mechanosensitive ion channel family protein [Desulfobacteraceae bacterium]
MSDAGVVKEVFHSISQVQIIQIVLIVAGAWSFVFLAQRWLPWLAERFTRRARLFLLSLVPVLRMAAIVIALFMIIPRIIEPTFENLAALMGAVGLALGFAFKDYASSLIAGIVTLFDTPYRVGDWIEINGTYGEVKSINMRAAEIVTPDDTVVNIPHLKLWDQLIFNANDGGENLLCVADFYLKPDHDFEQVKQALYDVALTSPFLQIRQPINVIVLNKPWGIHYRLKAYPIDLRKQFLFITDLTVRGKAALSSIGAEFTAIPAIETHQ